MRLLKLSALFLVAMAICDLYAAARDGARALSTAELNEELTARLKEHGFTGNIEATLEHRLGRKIDRKMADLGRLLFFDPVTSLNNDNSCAGCHSPTTAFADTQSIAIGIGSNGFIGPNRGGPQNQRRSPTIINAAFYPNLMWNSRFAALSGDPFNNTAGFAFPDPEGRTLSHLPHLLAAQAFIPPTVRAEMAGFDFQGDSFAIRYELLNRLNRSKAYRKLFGKSFREVKRGAPISFEMFGRAIAEFELTLVFANAPIDKFARGEADAMTDGQKRGALLFFGKARCVTCHAVSGKSNEMFSDFKQHVIGIPQIAPLRANVDFDGPENNEDYGLEQVTKDPADRYKFRTAPLRNLAMQPSYFHNGAFIDLEKAVRHYLNPVGSARSFVSNSSVNSWAAIGPVDPVIARLNPFLARGINLTDEEVSQLVEFLRDGLLDSRARPESLRNLIPTSVPSGRRLAVFE